MTRGKGYYDDRNGYRGPYEEYAGLLKSLLGPGKSILDIGCGRTFPMAPRLLATGAQVHGLDPVAAPELAPPGAVLRQGDAMNLPYDEHAFDVVASCAVLEHLQQPQAVFAQCRRVLKPGGTIVFLTPSKYDYVSVAARVIPNFLHKRLNKIVEGRGEDDTFATYYRANSGSDLKRIAARSGLAVTSLRYLDQSPYVFGFSRALGAIARGYHGLLRRMKPLHPLQGWLLVTLKNQS